jgi:hypothetical protein
MRTIQRTADLDSRARAYRDEMRAAAYRARKRACSGTPAPNAARLSATA